MADRPPNGTALGDIRYTLQTDAGRSALRPITRRAPRHWRRARTSPARRGRRRGRIVGSRASPTHLCRRAACHHRWHSCPLRQSHADHPVTHARVCGKPARETVHNGGSVRSAIEQVRSHGVRGMPLGDARRAPNQAHVVDEFAAAGRRGISFTHWPAPQSPHATVTHEAWCALTRQGASRGAWLPCKCRRGSSSDWGSRAAVSASSEAAWRSGSGAAPW